MSSQQPRRPSLKPQPTAEQQAAMSFEENGFNLSVGVQSVPLDQLLLPQNQPRRYFNEEAMQQLAASIKENGILQPLLVRPVGEKYEVVAGERRYKAALEVGLTEVPVTVREMSNAQAMQYALVENLQRENLNAVEETEGILQLLAIHLKCPVGEVPSLLYRMQKEAKGKRAAYNVIGQPEGEIVQSVFDSIGRMSWDSFVINRLALLNLPEDILNALRHGRIEYTKAREMAKLELESERKPLLEEAIARSLSLSQIRERVKAKKTPTERGELQARIEDIPKKAKKSKVWDNPKKRKKLESLLAEMEALLSEED